MWKLQGRAEPFRKAERRSRKAQLAWPRVQRTVPPLALRHFLLEHDCLIGNRWRVQEIEQGNIHVQLLRDSGGNPRGQKRVSPYIEEALMDSHRGKPQDFAPNLGKEFLEGVRGAVLSVP